jgi:tripartite motif-containing protein 9/67
MEYGGFSKINDTVGILLEFKLGIGTLSFYRNGVSISSLY